MDASGKLVYAVELCYNHTGWQVVFTSNDLDKAITRYTELLCNLEDAKDRKEDVHGRKYRVIRIIEGM